MSAIRGAANRIEAGREAGLLLSAQGGDLDCFLELLREHEHSIYRLCFALTCEPGPAAELMGDTARLVWRDLERLKVGRPFFPFAARIARNLAIAHSRNRPPGRSETPRTRPSGEPWGGSTGNPVLAAEEQRLFAAYDTMTPDDRAILALRTIEGLDCRRIGEIMGAPAGAIGHRLEELRGRLENASQPGVA